MRPFPMVSRLGPFLVLALLPLAFALTLLVMRNSSLPLWQVFNLDPDYYYLLNGLRLVEGLAPTDISHPGTPIQVLIAVILRLMHPGADAAAVVAAVLAAPEAHLEVITATIYPLVAAALFVLGHGMWRTLGRLAPALLAQSAPFLSMIIPKFSLHPKPEPFMIIAAALLVAAALAVIRAPRQGDRHAVLLGVVMGFGIACKLHFFALGLVPLFLLDRRRLLVIYPAATILAFLLFVAPAFASREIWFDWITRIFLYSGAYGEGAASVIDSARYPRAIVKLFGSKLLFSVIFAVSALMLAAYVRLRRRGLIAADPMARLLAGCMLGQLATVIVIAKQPAPHYMIPALMLSGTALACLWSLSRPFAPPQRQGRIWAAVAGVLILTQAPAVWVQNAELKRWSQDGASLDMARFARCAKVYYDTASALSYAFQRGDMNALGRYSPLLAERMPQDEYTWFVYDHTYWKRGLMQWNRPVELAAILDRHPCVVFRGSSPWQFQPAAQAAVPGLAFDDRCEAGEETIFTKGVRCDGSPVSALAK